MSNEGMPDLSAMIGEVMRDPAKMEQLRGIMAALGAQPSAADAPPPAPAPNEETPAPSPPLPSGDMLGSLLSNPAILAKLPALLGSLGETKETSSSGASHGASSGASSGASHGHRPDHRTALLLALKPYLSDGRRQMIDYIVNISRLGDQLGR